jgi:signal transduction histidine kinase
MSRSLDRLLLVTAVLVLGLGGLEFAILAHEPAGPLWIVTLYVVVGWVYAAAGLIAWRRRPSNSLGAVMMAGGLAWLAADLASIQVPSVWVVGTIVATVPLAVVVHIVLVFPSGRLTTRAARITVIAGYFVSLALQVPMYLFAPAVGPYDLLSVADRPGLVHAGQVVQDAAGAIDVAITAVILAMRLRAAAPAQRRVLAPLYVYGVLAVLLVPLLADVIGPQLDIPGDYVGALQVIELAGIPIAFTFGVLRGGFARTGEVEELGALLGDTGGSRLSLNDALVRTLGDTSLELAFWVPVPGRFVDAAGAEITMPPADSGRSMVDVHIGDRLAGAIVYDSTLIADAELVRTAGRVVAIALDRERLTAELLAGEAALRRSRERIVEAADQERRAIARNLHDGLQVRLVVLAIQAQDLVDAQLSEREREAATALRVGIDSAADELRDLVHAVMPAALIERGLAAAAEDLIDRIPVPTRLDVRGVGRPLSRAVQDTAYFVLSEALANALKHGHASQLTVRLSHSDQHLVVEVADDGVGGASTSGTGLRGLADRVDTLGGRIAVHSPPGQGTRLRAEIPCAS